MVRVRQIGNIISDQLRLHMDEEFQDEFQKLSYNILTAIHVMPNYGIDTHDDDDLDNDEDGDFASKLDVEHGY